MDQPEIGMPYYGGTIAAPVVKNILEESLIYLGVEPQYSEDEKKYEFRNVSKDDDSIVGSSEDCNWPR